MSKKLKKIIFIAVIIGVLILVFVHFSGNSQGPTTDLTTVGTAPETTATADSVGDEFLTTLLNMQAIKLNGDIFTSAPFTSLQDFSIILVQLGNQGRPNPFAPLGVDIGTGSVVTSSQVITNAPTILGTTTTTLSGALAMGTVATERWFEWGLTQTLGAVTTHQTGSTTPFSASLTGLSAGTTYYVKAAAKVNGQTVYGNLLTWKTNTTGL